MPRYSQRTGPLLDYAPPAAVTPLPQLSITRHFDDGEILVSFVTTYVNLSAGTLAVYQGIRLDGTPLTVPSLSNGAPPGSTLNNGATVLIPVSAGPHTIDVWVFGNGNPLERFSAGLSLLTVIQLPLWDTTNDIT